MKIFLSLLAFFVLTYSQGQTNYSISNLPLQLTEQSNSVIRSHDVHLEIEDYNDINLRENRVLTVLNENGLSSLDLYAYYDKSTKIKTLKATVYNALGQEIKEFKERDFTDVSAVSGGTLYRDDRLKYLEYKPVSYPVTIRFEKETKSSNTAFLQSFRPYTNYNQSVESASYKIDNNTDVELRSYENEFVEGTVIKSGTSLSPRYEVKNLPAIPREAYSTSLSYFTPRVRFALSRFKLEGEDGEFRSWKEFGNWQHKHLLEGQDELPATTLAKVKELTQGLTSTEEKAKVIYAYVQDQMRYISVQIGIGGWKPISAAEVDEKKYGDCKGLTNYTKALLKVAGVESNYCVVNAGREIIDIEHQFPSMQGNHVILNIPQEKKSDIWLECTSQDIPFNFLGTFTDDRNVLAIKPSGGEIMRTPAYSEVDNYQFTKANILLQGKAILANVEIKTKGTQYYSHYRLQNKNKKEINSHYMSYWDNLKELNLLSYEFQNNKDEVIFSENIDLKAENYIKIYGNDLILDINPFNKFQVNLPRYKARKTPFVIERGFVDEDEFIFNLNQLELNIDLEDVELVSRFGTYKLNFQLIEDKLIVRRYFKLNKNEYEKTDYFQFVKFFNEISKYDSTKISLTLS